MQQLENVKKIFHVASVRGEAGIGYVPVENIQFCVSKALRFADAEQYIEYIYFLARTDFERDACYSVFQQ